MTISGSKKWLSSWVILSLLCTIGSHWALAGGLFDKPFSKGGALSINKPFNKGGSLSIDKPLDKGGALSINKVYVPEKLRIGKVQSLAEVIIPVCWGSPQDCRGMEPEKAKASVKQQTGTTYPYYVIARFVCRDKRNGKVSGHECDVTQASSNSCAEALQAMASYPDTSGDPCAQCADIVDASEYWDGTSPEHIQDGPCRGQ
jgi:hypothetical protein